MNKSVKNLEACVEAHGLKRDNALLASVFGDVSYTRSISLRRTAYIYLATINVYFAAGTRAFHRELVSYGINLVNDELGHSSADTVDVVVQGFDTELVYEKLERACHFLRRGAAFIAANPDWVCPMPADEVLPDCGSICALLTASSGREPTYIGKPNRNMIDVISAMTGIPNERICAVGDRLYTDIAVAQNAGAVSVLVLSGETTADMVSAAERRPDYILADVHELHGVLRGQ